MPQLLEPGRDSPVSLVEITKANLRDYLRLKVAPSQEHLVAPVAVSIAQAHFQPEAWFRGIAAGGTAVGFAMLEDWSQSPESAPEDWWREPYIGLWRLLVDQRYQSLGFGTRALRLLIEHARARPGTKAMLLSFVPGEGGPEAFYRRFGFVPTGEVSEGEHVMRLVF
ncbi:MAG: GNAT family N-acetyltransferase [Burkholderiales bacterium]|nr:GNAT family N-acetyltransferase [Burkholderiales bacterium]